MVLPEYTEQEKDDSIVTAIPRVAVFVGHMGRQTIAARLVPIMRQLKEEYESGTEENTAAKAAMDKKVPCIYFGKKYSIATQSEHLESVFDILSKVRRQETFYKPREPKIALRRQLKSIT